MTPDVTSIAHYNLLEPIGAGAIGEVFRARDTQVGRTVALKIVDPRIVADEKRLARLARDAEAAMRLSHPNIATLWDAGETGGHAYLAYEFIAGRSLREEAGGAAMNPRRALDLAIQIADGVADAHAHGVVHGDLRPGTIMVTTKGSAKILDFGMSAWTRGGALRALAGARPDALPAEAMSVVPYLSPEQAVGDPVDARSDVFSLGVLAYELVTGKNPFAAPTAQQTILNVIKARAIPPSEANRATPQDLDAILARALAPDLGARQQSAAALAAELRSAAAVLDVRAGESTAPTELISLDDTPDRNAAGLLAGALAAAAVLFALIWYWLSR
jgi:serine/threonine protein kinase